MPTMIDHVVVVVRDLDAASIDAEQAGFTVTPGGEHAGGATHNALIPFADGSYIEVIAFRDPDERQTHKWWPRLWKGEGLVDFALLSSDLEAEAKEITARGLLVPPPADNGRLRPDGERLEWRAIQTQETVGESGLPFVIQDVTPRSLRVSTDASATTHRNGATGIARVTVVVGDIDAAARSFRALLGVDGRPSGEHAAGIRSGQPGIRFAVGPQWIELIQSAGDQPDDLNADDTAEPNLSRYHALYGNSPFEVILRTGDSSATVSAPRSGTLIDTRLLHGAHFRLTPA
jgi:catechol 2,3-dioxygenase-like lactoylglutathione lyase family enzyme